VGLENENVSVGIENENVSVGLENENVSVGMENENVGSVWVVELTEMVGMEKENEWWVVVDFLTVVVVVGLADVVVGLTDVVVVGLTGIENENDGIAGAAAT